MKYFFAGYFFAALALFAGCTQTNEQKMASEWQTTQNKWLETAKNAQKISQEWTQLLKNNNADSVLQSLTTQKVVAKNKALFDSLTAFVSAMPAKARAIEQSVETINLQLGQAQQQFEQLKTDIDKGKIAAEAAQKQLDGYQKQINDAQNRLKNMQDSWQELDQKYKEVITELKGLFE